jgi:hypothetical protein
MTLNLQQSKTFNMMLKHDKSMLIWHRISGKTTLIIHYIKEFVNKNSNTKILLITDSDSISYEVYKYILRRLKNITIENTKNEIKFINNNQLITTNINLYESVLNYIKPDLIIYDEICRFKPHSLQSLNIYIRTKKCKCIITTTILNEKILEILDNNNSFYISLFPCNDINEPNYITYDMKHLSYKNNNLVDVVLDIQYERHKKLKNIDSLYRTNY